MISGDAGVPASSAVFALRARRFGFTAGSDSTSLPDCVGASPSAEALFADFLAEALFAVVLFLAVERFLAGAFSAAAALSPSVERIASTSVA